MLILTILIGIYDCTKIMDVEVFMIEFFYNV